MARVLQLFSDNDEMCVEQVKRTLFKRYCRGLCEKYQVVKDQDPNMFRLLQDMDGNSQMRKYYLEIGKHI